MKTMKELVQIRNMVWDEILVLIPNHGDRQIAIEKVKVLLSNEVEVSHLMMVENLRRKEIQEQKQEEQKKE